MRAVSTRSAGLNRSTAARERSEDSAPGAARIALLPRLRDDLVRFAVKRLAGAQDWQAAEHSLTQRGASYPFKQAVQRGAAKPDPARWGEVAAAWRAAIDALCDGDMGRAAALIDVAHQVEEDARAATTEALSTAGLPHAEDPPDALAWIQPGDAVDATPRPQGRAIADAVQAVTTQVPDMPARTRGRDPWWTVRDAGADDDGDEP
jgi:hypothetical protein